MVDGECVSAVENIQDPRLETYAYSLYVSDWSDTEFKLSRAQFVELVVQAAKVDTENLSVSERMKVSQRFDDVAMNDWYVPYIYYAYTNGILSGQEVMRSDDDGKEYVTHILRPDDLLSRAEAAKILSNVTMKKDALLPDYTQVFIDVPENNSLSRYIENTYKQCLLHGTNTMNGEVLPGEEGREFSPDSPITLGETMKILYNMTHHDEEGTSEVDNFLDVIGK